MPIPIPSTGGALTPVPTVERAGHRPYYLRERQNWAIEQERMRHNGALYHIGEWIFLILMWHQLDFERGLVGRCSRCFVDEPTNKGRRIAEVYKQPLQNECPVCFGTTFEGGVRALIVRPAIAADVEESERQGAKGSMHPAALTFETTYDFRCRAGDYIVRADNSRWRINSADRLQVRTGFDHPDQFDDAVAYRLPAGLEDASTVAYKLPPDENVARLALRQPMRFPGNFSAHEIENGPLIPPSILD
jgi:hypothetical protein